MRGVSVVALDVGGGGRFYGPVRWWWLLWMWVRCSCSGCGRGEGVVALDVRDGW